MLKAKLIPHHWGKPSSAIPRTFMRLSCVEMKESFSFPREARETSQAIQDTQIRLEYLEAVVGFGLNWVDPPNPIVQAMLIPFKKSFDKKALANLKRSEKMKGNSNAKKQTKQSKTVQNSDKNTGNNCDLATFWETEGIYNINNSKLYYLVELFTREKITNYKQIYTLSKKNWEKKYFYTQYLEAEKITKKTWIETFETILKFCLVDDFWKNQILSIAKLNKKNKDWAYYYDVMIDKIRERKPPTQTVYSAELV